MSKSMSSQLEGWYDRDHRREAWSVMGVALCVCFTTFLGNRRWDANALLVERTRVDTTDSASITSNKPVDDSQPVFLEVEIRNKTGKDIMLPPSVKIRETTKFSPSLKLSEFGLNGPVVLRAGGTTKVQIRYDLYCKVGHVRKDCIRRALGDIDQVILFDSPDGFEIRVPLTDALDTYLTSTN